MKVNNSLYDYFFTGCVKEGGSWGGLSCMQYVPLEVHTFETIMWIVVAIYVYKSCKIYQLVQNLQQSAEFELKKSKLQSIGAIIFPDTTGLDQPYELEQFWIQHYMISIVPLYILARNNFAASRIASFQTILVSAWFVLVLHWPIFEFIDLYGQVNVQFMLCPPASLTNNVQTLPWYFRYPSYRVTGTFGLFIFSIITTGAYLLLVWFIRSHGEAVDTFFDTILVYVHLRVH
eukprot:gene6721-13615_t